MQVRVLAVLTFVGLALFALQQKSATVSASDQPTTNRVPVIVELFTSEGCSSCPPADALLRRLEEKQPVPNAEIIVLGEHVDYWNYIGWTDRFSSKQFTERQQQYANTFNLDSSYTPQMVVDGRSELNGADEPRAKRAINDAARQPRVAIGLTLVAVTADSAKLKVQIAAAPIAKDADVFLAVTESRLETQVKNGENGGRVLLHTGVVRELKKIGEATSAGFQAEPQLQIQNSWKRNDLRALVFIQEKGSRHILGATTVRLAN